MPERIARVAQDYAGRRVQPGEKFEVEDRHCRLLEAIRRIEPETAAPAPPVPPLPALATRDMVATRPAAYATRDMAAAPRKTRRRESLLGKAR
jgi:hypothetical protein